MLCADADCTNEAKAFLTASTTVYRYIENGVVKYVGITNNLARRAGEHLATRGWTIEKIAENLSRKDAKAIEQALIEKIGLPNLYNQINSISTKNPIYQDAIKQGNELIGIFKL